MTSPREQREQVAVWLMQQGLSSPHNEWREPRPGELRTADGFYGHQHWGYEVRSCQANPEHTFIVARATGRYYRTCGRLRCLAKVGEVIAL